MAEKAVLKASEVFEAFSLSIEVFTRERMGRFVSVRRSAWRRALSADLVIGILLVSSMLIRTDSIT